jgi:pimeloyl-ACP methyl ester carboxylesterase
MDDLYYEVSGSGPVLLVIPGGAGHPMGLDAFTRRLAERFTVVTYDPMGLAHGRLGEPAEDQRVVAWSGGARLVLEEVLPDGEFAYVLGFSSGGIAALDLLARHPERLRHVVAHEPPCVAGLPDAARHRAMFGEVYETYRAAGVGVAMARLNAGLEGRSWEAPQADTGTDAPGTGIPSRTGGELTPMDLFLAHVLRQFTAYEPDWDALKLRPVHLTLAAGHDSRGQLLHHTAESLAQLSGGGFVEFPGGHIGAATHGAEFAERLAETVLPVGTPGVPLTT